MGFFQNVAGWLPLEAVFRQRYEYRPFAHVSLNPK